METLNSFGPLPVTDGIELQIGDQRLAIQPQGGSRHLYRRARAGETLTEKILVSIGEMPRIAVYPVPPIYTPEPFAHHVLLKLSTPIALPPSASVEGFLTLPFEVGLFTLGPNVDLHLEDVFSISKPKYALYGTPENGFVCRYWSTQVGWSAIEAKRYEEALCRFVFRNTSEEAATINRVVLEAPTLTFYYDKDAVFLESVEVTIESSTVAVVQPTGRPPHPGLQRVPAREEEKKARLMMEWGY